MEENKEVHERARAVLQDFEDVFALPTKLPPQRYHDHKIPLMPNTPPMYIRPYRHPPNQKVAIEVMVKEMLDSGVIKLDKYIVKDKFPIPVIKELIDELGGALVKTVEEHCVHLQQVIQVMRDNKLFAQKSSFAVLKVEYLRHVITGKGVAIDPSKIEAMRNSLIPSTLKHYKGDKLTYEDEILRRKGKIVVGNDLVLKQLIVHFHGGTVGGHSRVLMTTKKLNVVFYWKELKRMVKQFMIECDICQRRKPDLSAYHGLLQPFHIPEKIWTEVAGNGYLRKGQKQSQKDKNRARERKEREEKAKSQSQKVKVEPEKSKSKPKPKAKKYSMGPPTITWEVYADVLARFPDFDAATLRQVSFQGEWS
ncbi:reverse transcriptase [Tanacetum coccineum]